MGQSISPKTLTLHFLGTSFALAVLQVAVFAPLPLWQICVFVLFTFTYMRMFSSVLHMHTVCDTR